MKKLILRLIRNFISNICRTKWILLGARIGRMTNIDPSVYIGFPGNFKMGANGALNKGVFISSMTSVEIGDNTHVGPYSAIFDSDHKMPIKEGGNVQLPISVGNGVWIGSHVVILKGVEIGDNCTIGAGSIVNKSIPANSIAVGVPAKVIGHNEKG